MEADDNLRKVECLRGRLLAERAASRVAKEDAELMGNKLTELENKLMVEIKSRNRAEKMLNLLMKKLESLNLSYVSDNSSILEKSCMSSVSSSSSTASKKAVEDEQPKTQIRNSAIEESKTKSPTISQDLEDNASQITSSSQTHFSPAEEESLISEERPNFDESSEVNSVQNYKNPKTDDPRFSSTSDEAQDDYVDDSMALVPVDLPKELRPSDQLIAKENVRDVLDALRHAREKLHRLSMETRHMIKVGSK